MCSSDLPNATVWVAVRPEKIRVTQRQGGASEAPAPDNSIAATVVDIGYLGDLSIYKLRSETGVLLQAAMANSGPLAARGVGVDEARDFLNPTLKRMLPEPSSLKDMDNAVARAVRAVEQGERAHVHGKDDRVEIVKRIVDGAERASGSGGEIARTQRGKAVSGDDRFRRVDQCGLQLLPALAHGFRHGFRFR